MHDEVTWILAAANHETVHETIALLVPHGTLHRFIGAVCALLRHEIPMVLMDALGHYHDLLTDFAKDGTGPASLRRLAPGFAYLTMLSEGEWHIPRSIADSLSAPAVQRKGRQIPPAMKQVVLEALLTFRTVAQRWLFQLAF